MVRQQIKIVLATGIVVFAIVPASAATLPLKDGNYTYGACNGGSDITQSIGIYDYDTDYKPLRGKRFIAPNAEDQTGACTLGAIKAMGNHYSGSAKCADGGSRIQYSSGTYRFSYDVINPTTFVSRGKTYKWCSLSR